ncbi:MAG: acyl-CoA thioesterase [Deltaproteobacteria bacterium]|nr:acyl-CoA thioesterase [Deltaproteobacteria bacterium]
MTEEISAAHDRQVEVSIPVRFGDTDPYGVVYFASYFRYCHHGIEEFFRTLGFRPGALFRNQEKGFGLPIVGASCDFLRPVRYGDFLRLVVTIFHMKEKSLTFQFQFHRNDSPELVAQGRATLVCIDASWRSRPLPEDLTAVMQSWIRNEGVP